MHRTGIKSVREAVRPAVCGAVDRRNRSEPAPGERANAADLPLDHVASRRRPHRRRRTPARRTVVALVVLLLNGNPAWTQPPDVEWPGGSAPNCVPDEATEEAQAVLRPRWRRRGTAVEPIVRTTPIETEPLAGAWTVGLDACCEPGCDPVLAGLFIAELHAAVNSRPLLRVQPLSLPPSPQTLTGPVPTGPALPAAVPASPFLLQEPVITTADLVLSVRVRAIDPYRPMRLDAALELRDAATGAVLVRFDDVWQAPVDTVPLRPTRHGWLRRNLHPTPAVSEGAALEASSPRLFLRSTSRRLAERLEASITQDGVAAVSGSGPSAPAAFHPPQ